jgi:Tol biopolymer transport system component
VVPICDVEQGGVEGTWNRDGTILFAMGFRGAGSSTRGLFRVSDGGGGKPVTVTTPDLSSKETGHRSPIFLPDQRHFLYLAQAPNTVYVGSLDSTERKRLFNSDSNAVYVPPGYLIFVRQGTLLAQRFDGNRLTLGGDPFPIAQNVRSVVGNGRATFSVSDNGTLVYRKGNVFTQQQRVVWFDRNGNRDDSIEQAKDTREPSLAPDQKHLAVVRADLGMGLRELWLIDLMTGLNSRLSLGGLKMSLNPVWSPDSSRIVFKAAADPSSIYDLYHKHSTGISNEQLLFKSDQDKTPTDWSSDGRFILFDSIDPVTKSDIWFLPLSGDSKPQPFSKTGANETGARFSPDGKWVAYASDEAGRYQIYIQPFPSTGQRFQISFDGGTAPRWRHDGKELFFRDGANGNLMAADIKSGSAIEASKPKTLFRAFLLSANYDVTADGQHFIGGVPAGSDLTVDSSPLTVVLNWTAGLKK